VLFPAPLGLHTRHLVAAYARNTFIVLSGVLVIALSIDLATFLSQVLAKDASANFIHQVFHVVWYILLRCIDQITEFLPLACFLGVVWSEIAHTRSGERLLIQLSGRTPHQCLAPLIIFSVIIGTLQAALLIYLRPSAVMAQTAARLGLYGEIFDRSPTLEQKWIRADNIIIHARIEFSAPPALYDVEFYRFNPEGQLQQVVQAASATPVGDDQHWLFNDGESWTLDTRLPSSDASSEQLADASNGVRFEHVTIRLDIGAPLLSNFGIQSKYLPAAAYRAISRLHFSPDSEFRAWAQARYAFPLDAAAMAVMAGGLSLILVGTEVSFFRTTAIVLAGYFAHLLMRLFLLLASHDWMNPIVAAWLVPAIILAFPALVYYLMRSTAPNHSDQALLYVDGA
jgi:lipopolysaccharide export system permease protein